MPLLERLIGALRGVAFGAVGWLTGQAAGGSLARAHQQGRMWGRCVTVARERIGWPRWSACLVSARLVDDAAPAPRARGARRAPLQFLAEIERLSSAVSCRAGCRYTSAPSNGSAEKIRTT